MNKQYINRMTGMGAWFVAFLFLCLQTAWGQATESGLKVTGGTLGTDYVYEENVYTVKSDKALTFSGTTTTDHITVDEGITANISLNTVSVDVSSKIEAAAILLKKNAKLTLTLVGANTLKSGNNVAGIQLMEDSYLVITAENATDHSLESTGGDYRTGIDFYSGAGIGGKRSDSYKATVEIVNGKINAIGGDYGHAGHGVGIGDNLVVLIKGGSVTATGGSQSLTGSVGEGIKGKVTVLGGTFTNCTIKNIISFDETNTSFSNCDLTFTIPAALTKDYSNCIFRGETTVQGETFTNCTFTGNSFLMNKGTINNTDGSNITAENITINGGSINVEIPDTTGQNTRRNAIGSENSTIIINNGTIVAEGGIEDDGFGKNYYSAISGSVSIKGGHITAISPGNAAAIGGNGGRSISETNGENITITGGVVIAISKGTGAGIGGATNHEGNDPSAGKNITITGGTVIATSANGTGIGGGGTTGDTENIIISGGSVFTNGSRLIGTTPTNGSENVYLGITPAIADVTDVSVDSKPYYISENYPKEDNKEQDNKLYLYMTGKDHTVTVRTNNGQVTTYTATYVSGGVSSNGTQNGYFTFNNGTVTTPDKTPAVSFEVGKGYTAEYNSEQQLEVTLTITVDKPSTNSLLRSAAMNSVQLLLTDGQGVTYYSDRLAVDKSGSYTFTFATKDLNADTYTLTAEYGGDSNYKKSDAVKADLVITKATPSYTVPSGLTATYGDKLSAISLDKGWAWDNPSTEVGNAGTHQYAATFTPTDTRNYNTVQTQLSVAVNKKQVTNAPNDPTALSAITYDRTRTLAGISLDKDWKWADGTIVPTVSTSTYKAYYDTDYANYDWSSINGYNNTNQRVEKEIALTVNKAPLTADNFSYDATNKQVTYTGQDADDVTITTYYSHVNSSSVYSKDMPTDPGTYQVSIDITSANYTATEKLTADSWQFTIVPPRYAVTIDSSIKNGTVTADKSTAAAGETITLTVTPADGYERESLSYSHTGGTEAIGGTSFEMPAGAVTVTATFKAKQPDPDPTLGPDPTPGPDPEPVYYTVTLPAVEGATTDPAADDYEVEAWDSFGFFLTLDEAYNLSKPLVSTSRGETLEPRASDGKYVVRDVRSDLVIRIDGIVKNPDPVANETIDTGTLLLWGGEGSLYLRLGSRQEVSVYTFTGSLLRRAEAVPGDTRWTLPAGNYIVRIGGNVYKVAVR